MASAWSQLDQLLTCAICLDRYRNPKLLPCQHTFCMEPCLEGLIDYARRQIKCPECRAEHRIPYQGVQAFPTNVTLMRFLELHRDITGEEPEPPPSMMERCNVCSEKSYLEKCAHCEKKICQDCKEAHVDILRREINRINNQVRRGLHRLSEALTQTKKNAEKLQMNCTQVKDEIEDIVRRYSKDLRNTEGKLKHDLEIYTETELKAINKLKEDLEAEMTNMSSNCDLVDKHIKDDAEWSDAELLEYKEIFLKTLDFLRAFDADNSDFARRIKFQPRADPDVLHRNIADFGELKISAPSVPTQQSLAPPQSNALMRSQSDHRLAAQFARRQDNRSFADINQRYGSDTEREGRPTSPLFSRTSRRDTDTGYRRYSERSRDYDYQDRDVGRNRYIREENSSSSVSSRWRDSEDYGYRSRYNRDYDDIESEPQHTRTVRFADDPPQNQTQRERLLDMGDATKGPLSGIIRLMDSPKVMERLHQNEVRQKQQQNDKERKAQEPPATPQPAPPPPAPTTPAAPQPPPRRPPSRQQSEDDIDRQKKMNQQQAASSTTPATPATPAAQQTQNSNTTTTTNTEPQPRPISRRVTALQKEDETKTNSPGDRGQRKDNRSPDVSETTASPRSDVTTHDECPEAPTRSRRQLSTTSSTETDLPESPSSPRASESPRRAESPRLLSRQVSREEVKLDSKDSPTPSWRSMGTRDTTPNCEQSRLSRSPSGTIRDDTSPYTTRRHAYTRHQSDTRFDRPVTNFGIGRQSPISEEHSSKSGYTGSHRPSSLVIGRSSPTRRISLEDYTGQERPDYNRFRTALSRTSSTSSMSLHSPTSPDDGARSPSAVTTCYSPLYRRNIAVPISGLEPTSNDESCSSDSSSSSRSSSSCSSSSSTSEYVDAVSRPSSVDNYSEAESPPFRCPRPTLGKAVSLDAESGSQPAKTPLDKKVPHQVDQQQKKSEEEEDDDDEEEEEEEVLRPKQSSFYSRLTNNNHRRLPDPEPRLLQEPNDSSDDEEEDDDDDDEDDELADDKTLSVKQGDNAEESDSEVSSSSSSSSESEDSEESEETKVQNEPIPSVTTSTASQRKDSHSSKVASTNNIPNKKTENPSETTSDDEDDDDDEDDAEENGDAIETSNKPNADSTVRIRSSGAEETSSDGTSHGSRRKSDDADATDSSSSSSNQYQSLSHNSTPIVSNGTMAAEENLSSEGSSSATSSGSTSSHRREPRYSSYRRGPITRSKSSHELGLGTENVEDEEDDEPIIPTYRSRYDRMSEGSNALSRSRSHHALKSNDHSPEETNTTAALSSSSNSSWAKYLRSKYGSNATSRVVPRSRSSHNLYSRSDSETSEDDGTSGRDSILSSSYGFSNPRSTYVQKRRMMLKIGARGTDASCFTWPRGVAVGPDNSIVVADSSNHRVQVFDAIGKFLHEFGTYGSAEGEFDCLAGVAVNRIGQFIVSDRYNHRIQLFDPTGRFLRSFGCEGRTDGRFNYPWGITTDSLGFIYVCDKENHRIQVFQSDGTFVGKFGSIGSRPGQLEHPHYIAVSNTNRVVVSDSNNHRIQIFDVNGRSLSTFGSEGSEEGQFKFPRGVAVDDQGYIIVGDSGNNRVQIFHPDGTFLRGFGNWGSGDGEFKGLEGIAVTSGGSILVCDRENHRIQVF